MGGHYWEKLLYTLAPGRRRTLVLPMGRRKKQTLVGHRKLVIKSKQGSAVAIEQVAVAINQSITKLDQDSRKSWILVSLSHLSYGIQVLGSFHVSTVRARTPYLITSPWFVVNAWNYWNSMNVMPCADKIFALCHTEPLFVRNIKMKLRDQRKFPQFSFLKNSVK